MKLKDYIKKLQEIADKHPNLTVVYAADDEGNRFSEVFYDPSYGHFDGESFENGDKKINAVCVN
jgi:UDP-N-acetylglucosamine 2-epimerase